MAWPAGRGLDEMTPRDPLGLFPREVSISAPWSDSLCGSRSFPWLCSLRGEGQGRTQGRHLALVNTCSSLELGKENLSFPWLGSSLLTLVLL